MNVEIDVDELCKLRDRADEASWLEKQIEGWRLKAREQKPDTGATKALTDELCSLRADLRALMEENDGLKAENRELRGSLNVRKKIVTELGRAWVGFQE